METRREANHIHDSRLMKRLSGAIAGNSCPICLCDVVDRRAAVVPSCMHAYCLECIERWSRVKRTCPLCSVEFESLLCRINLSARTFREERLSRSGEGKIVNSPVRRWSSYAQERITRRSMREFHSTSSRTRPLPRRRSFGRPGEVDADVVAERVRQWRASIYERRMKAVPCSSKNLLLQRIAEIRGARECVVRRIEPWVQRELHAILRDPDPSVIVHVATSLFISIHEKRHEGSSGQSDLPDDFLTPLRRFLHENTNIFWHELRCFAESSLSMETYDSVVDYKFME